MNIGFTTEKQNCVFCRRKTNNYLHWIRKGVRIEFFVCDSCLDKYGLNDVDKNLKKAKTVGIREALKVVNAEFGIK